MHSPILALIVMVIINVWFFYIWRTWSQVNYYECISFAMARMVREDRMADRFAALRLDMFDRGFAIAAAEYKAEINALLSSSEVL